MACDDQIELCDACKLAVDSYKEPGHRAVYKLNRLCENCVMRIFDQLLPNNDMEERNDEAPYNLITGVPLVKYGDEYLWPNVPAIASHLIPLDSIFARRCDTVVLPLNGRLKACECGRYRYSLTE